MRSNDSVDLWGLDCINIDDARSFISNYYKKKIRVGVIDYGVGKHKELDEILLDDLSVSYTSDADPFADLEEGHGTRIAGIIGAKVDGIGMEGVCSTVEIGSLKISYQLDATNNSLTGVDTVISALNFATEKNMRIVNCSFGCKIADVSLCTAMQNFNGLIVCGAGNSYNNIDGELEDSFYPASFGLNNIISVGAIDNNKQIWCEIDNSTPYEVELGSNYGSISVDVFAPGVNIKSTDYTIDTNNSSYSTDSGTSMAAPYVTGIAALILSIEDSCLNGPFNGNNLREIIMQSVTTCDNLYGYCRTGGYVDAKRALEVALTYQYTPSYEYYDDFYHSVTPYMGSSHFEAHTWLPAVSINARIPSLKPTYYQCTFCGAIKF